MADNPYQSPFDDESSKQAATYLKALNELRISITGLGKPITDVSRNIKDLNSDLSKLSGTVNQMAKDSQTADGANNKLSDGLEKLAKTHETLAKVIDIAKGSFATFKATLTAGLTLIIAYSPEILNIVNSWIKDLNSKSSWRKSRMLSLFCRQIQFFTNITNHKVNVPRKVLVIKGCKIYLPFIIKVSNCARYNYGVALVQIFNNY